MAYVFRAVYFAAIAASLYMFGAEGCLADSTVF